jgi:hypothetical protein
MVSAGFSWDSNKTGGQNRTQNDLDVMDLSEFSHRKNIV